MDFLTRISKFIKEVFIWIKEWTIVEWLIAICFALVFIALSLSSVVVISHRNTQCIGGYLFTNPLQLDYTHPSTPIQIMDSQGKGIRCE